MVHLDKAAINLAKMRGEKEDKSVTVTVTAVQYKEKESQDDQMDRKKEVETVDDNKLDTDGQGKVNIKEKYTDHRQDISGHACRTSRDGWRTFGRIDITKHCIELTKTDGRPINSAHHRSGPKPHEFKKK